MDLLNSLSKWQFVFPFSRLLVWRNQLITKLFFKSKLSTSKKICYVEIKIWYSKNKIIFLKGGLLHTKFQWDLWKYFNINFRSLRGFNVYAHKGILKLPLKVKLRKLRKHCTFQRKKAIALSIFFIFILILMNQFCWGYQTYLLFWASFFS